MSGRTVVTLTVVGAVIGGFAGRVVAGSSPSLLVTCAITAVVAVVIGVAALQTRRAPRSEIAAVDGRPARDEQWWAPTAPSGAPKRAELAGHSTVGAAESAGRGRVPQRPRCGAFEPDLTASNGTYAFACRSCTHEWTWSRERAWPAVRIDPRLRASTPNH